MTAKPTELRLAYINAQGLTLHKLDILHHYITNLTFDIICVSETWWIDTDTITKHPYTIWTSKRTAHRVVGHQNGGMLLLAHPDIKPLLNLIRRTEYTLDFAIHGNLFRSVYLPPSLPATSCDSLLRATPQPTCIFGDFNIRLGSVTDDNPKLTNHPPDRARSFWALQSYFKTMFVKATTGQSRTDHLLSSTPLLEWHYVPAPFPTDHQLMDITIPIRLRSAAPNAPVSTERLFLKYLDTPEVVEQLVQHYDEDSFQISLVLKFLITEGGTLPATDRQLLIDEIGSLISKWIYLTGKRTLGAYEVEQMKKTGDRMEIALASDTSPTTALRFFKRTLRGKNTVLGARDNTKTPQAEVIAHYTDIYTPEPKPDRPPLLPPTLPSTSTVETLEAATHVCRWEHVQKAILQYPTTKSLGPDHVAPRLLKALTGSKVFETHICNLFWLCVTFGTTPQCWNEATVTLLSKTDSDITYASDTRPISNTQVLRRIFEKRLLSFWNKQTWTELHHTQAGFRSRYSCIIQALVSDESIKQGATLSAYLDLKAAYDRVPFWRLLTRLDETTCPTWTKNIIYTLMMRNPSSRFVVNGTLTDPVARGRGLFQGSLISPLLFNIFLDPLLHDLALSTLNPHPYPSALAYADDIKLQASDSTVMQSLLTICDTWAPQNEMIFNLKKSALVPRHPLPAPLRFCGAALPVMTEYKYLGFPTRGTGIHWPTHLTARTEKALKGLKHGMIIGKNWPEWIRLTIYRSFYRSYMDYGLHCAAIWMESADPTGRFYDMINDVHKMAIQWIFGRLKPLRLHESMTALGTTAQRLQELIVGLSIHLDKLTQTNPFWKLYEMAATTYNRLRNVDSVVGRLKRIPPLRKEWVAQNKTRGDKQQSTWQTFARNHRLAILTCKTTDTGPLHVLPNYILSHARIGASQTDRVLRITDPTIRAAAIHWRENTALVRKTCWVCNGTLTRRCANKCFNWKDHPQYAGPYDIWKRDCATLGQLQLHVGQYSILDALLNLGHETDFYNAYSLLLGTTKDASLAVTTSPDVPQALLPAATGCRPGTTVQTQIPTHTTDISSTSKKRKRTDNTPDIRMFFHPSSFPKRARLAPPPPPDRS